MALPWHRGRRALSTEAHGALGLHFVLGRYPFGGLCGGEPGESAMEADAAHSIELAC